MTLEMMPRRLKESGGKSYAARFIKGDAYQARVERRKLEGHRDMAPQPDAQAIIINTKLCGQIVLAHQFGFTEKKDSFSNLNIFIDKPRNDKAVWYLRNKFFDNGIITIRALKLCEDDKSVWRVVSTDDFEALAAKLQELDLMHNKRKEKSKKTGPAR